MDREQIKAIAGIDQHIAWCRDKLESIGVDDLIKIHGPLEISRHVCDIASNEMHDQNCLDPRSATLGVLIAVGVVVVSKRCNEIILEMDSDPGPGDDGA